MFLPLGDEPNPRGTPLVTYVLIAVNCAVYLLVTLPLSLVAPDVSNPVLREYLELLTRQYPDPVRLHALLRSVSSYDLVVFSYGYRPADPSLLALFTSMFLHGGFMHLAGNMLFLWIYGDNVEHRLGRMPFLFWYLAGGAAATLFHVLFAADSPVPLVGASGAISGVLGFYFLWFPRNRVRLWLVLFPFFMNVVYAPARLVLGLYLLVDNLLPFLVVRGPGGVAYGAHIGGFLVGWAAAWAMDRRTVVARPEEFGAKQIADERPAEVSSGQLIADLIASGRLDEAAELYFQAPAQGTRRLLGPADSLLLGDWLADNSHPRAALIVYQRHLRDYPRGPGLADAHARLGFLLLHAFGQAAGAYQHFLDALDLGVDSETAALVRQGLAEIEALQKFKVERLSR